MAGEAGRAWPPWRKNNDNGLDVAAETRAAQPAPVHSADPQASLALAVWLILAAYLFIHPTLTAMSLWVGFAVAGVADFLPWALVNILHSFAVAFLALVGGLRLYRSGVAGRNLTIAALGLHLAGALALRFWLFSIYARRWVDFAGVTRPDFFGWQIYFPTLVIAALFIPLVMTYAKVPSRAQAGRPVAAPRTTKNVRTTTAAIVVAVIAFLQMLIGVAGPNGSAPGAMVLVLLAAPGVLFLAAWGFYNGRPWAWIIAGGVGLAAWPVIAVVVAVPRAATEGLEGWEPLFTITTGVALVVLALLPGVRAACAEPPALNAEAVISPTETQAGAQPEVAP